MTSTGKRHMVAVLGALVVALLVGACSNEEQPSSQGQNQLGSAATLITLQTLDGEQVSLEDYRGQLVLLNFWSAHCPPCRAEMPSMEKLYQQFHDHGLAMLAVNVDDDGGASAKKLLQQHNYTFPVLLDPDGQARRAYGVQRFPETFIISPEGRVLDKVIGAIEWDSPDVVAHMRKLLPKE